MQHKSFGNVQCPIACSLERVGEWWSILILRDAFLGSTRFDQFQKSLGIAPNMLTRRLNKLVDSGLLERSRYSDHHPRDEYTLTVRGRDFRPVHVGQQALRSGWAERCAREHRDRQAGGSHPGRSDQRASDTTPRLRSAPGPATNELTRRQLAPANERAGTLSRTSVSARRSKASVNGSFPAVVKT